MKKSLVVVVFLLSLVTAAPLAASPLYGGYNGQSESWIDVYYFGIDDQERWWVRVPLDLTTLRLNFKYESDGVISVEISGQGLSAQGSYLFGIDTNDLFWGEFFESGVSGGFDGDGTTWSEQNILGFLGTGSDSNDNLWGFITIDLQGFILMAGIDLSFLDPETAMKSASSSAQAEQIGHQPLASLLQGEESEKLINFLTVLSNDDELKRKVTALTAQSLDLKLLLTFAVEKVFTQERREVIEGKMNNFIDAESAAQ